MTSEAFDPLNGPVLLSFEEGTSLASIILNRPRSLNAINVPLLKGLVTSLRQVKASTTKVCIIASAGTSFCSGEDLKETLAPLSEGTDAEELRGAFELLQEVTRLMTTSDTIFLAAVRGWAIGGGAEIALASDFVVASPDAIFRFPEIIHGHAPTGGITGRLPQLVGLQQAKELLLFGDDLNASRALSLNLVAEVVSDPLQCCKERALQLVQRSGRSLSTIKKGIEKATFPHAENILCAEVDAASWCFAYKDAMDAFSKFQKRRDPLKHNMDQEETLISSLIRASYLYPQKPFLRFKGVDISYAQFTEDVAILAASFRYIGIGPGDVIGAMMLNSEDMVRCWFATMWIGAIWAPLHTEFRGIVLRRAIELVSPKIMIIDDIYLEYMPSDLHLRLYVRGELKPGINSLSSLANTSALHEPAASVSASVPCTLLFTSGTTGPSKACELPHSYFISAGKALIKALELNSEDVIFCPFPLCHADASSLTIVPSLLLGATAALSQRFSASQWWDEIRQSRATVADFMGATLSILNKADPKPVDATNTLRTMWGVPVPAWVEDFERRFDLKVVEVYGSTETGLPVVQPIDRARVKGSCGKALEGVRLRIIDENGEDVSAGTVGELLVYRTPGEHFSGYYKNAIATGQSLQDDWFHTGDLCRLDAEGNLFFVGRRKHVIRRRGENISSFEVEEGLLIHPDILECAAYGVPSDLTEEDLMVSVVKRSGSSLKEDDVHRFAQLTMSRFLVPRYIEFLDTLPRNPTSKLEIYKLQEAWTRGERASSVRDFKSK